MKSSLLKSVIHHAVRLDILSCLAGDPRTLRDLSVKIERDETHVAYHLSVLNTYGLVEKEEKSDEADLYVARLDGRPVWIAWALDSHRLRA